MRKQAIRRCKHAAMLALAGMAVFTGTQAYAEVSFSNKLLLTGGVSQVEGAAGGGLTPWAVIGGYGTSDEMGANLHYSYADSSDFALSTYGITLGFDDRFEISLAEQRFNVSNLNSKLGWLLGRSDIKQQVIGAKLRIAGEAILDADTWVPQVAVGLQYKNNQDGDLVKFLGAEDDDGMDYYVSATKLLLDKSLLINGTLRMTRANQLGILGFGGDRGNHYEPQLELSAAYLLAKNLAIGAEYRMKPDNLGTLGGALEEDDWYDVFVAWAPNKHVSLTAAYVYLGNIVDIPGAADFGDQKAVYLSAQIGF